MRAVIAAVLVLSSLSAPAVAQEATVPAAWLDPLSMGIGALLVLLPAVAALAFLRWRMANWEKEAVKAGSDAERMLESLLAAPDGFYGWLAERELCSRRLAVLLGLYAGTDSTFMDVLESFAAADAARLDLAVRQLRQDGQGFELEVGLRDGGRRVRAAGVRASNADGAALADLVWMHDVTEGAAVEEELAERIDGLAAERERLDGLLGVLSVPVWVRDDDLSLVHVNRAYARSVDAASPMAAVAGQIELASDGSVREARALAARARAAGEPRSESFHLVLGGQRRFTEITEAPFETGDGELLTAGFAMDLTRIEELQAELARHASAHAEVLEHLSTAIAIFSTDTRLTFFNTAFMRLWRLESDWLAAQPTYGAVLDSLRERRLLPEVADYRAYKEDELKRFISLIDAAETLLHLPDGRTLRRMISAHPYGGLIFTYEDVTDTLALERSFNTMLAVQRETLDHLHEGVAVFKGDGRLRLYNPAFGRIWGLADANLAGEPHLAELVEAHRPYFEGRPDRASDWPLVRDRLIALFNDRVPREGRLERFDDTIVDFTSVPLPDGAMLLTWLDVTDTARVEKALRERNEALAAADMLKSEFIANVSAEVRKPLTTVIGFSEMLSAEYFGKLNKRQHDYAKGITEAGQGLQTLISDILDLAAIDAGQMRLELDTVDVHPMLSAVLGLVRERVREKKLSLEFDCPLDMGWIVADERRLKQVLFNLIGNAVKDSEAGGKVWVGAERRPAEIAFTITDSGPGMSAEEQARIFGGDAYRRRSEVVPVGGGPAAGLGLALVERFVDLHGGRMEIASAPGEGTTVTVRLPTGEGLT
ncbi:histidine kinase [Paramagnetospirillum kuznetsovii]|uniref:histidine kinase n=1 Tax=Paramagnetospirillum kuznetsovii TaxID=2053833 RepID=A0A364NXC7_9PROT|nr:PAS domain-containing sensor histidine kinase [Paramagnetospirillum kuznetsovii]RAU21696.1 histidine kinase [Paramagnetospirillum kuznetsovii]